MTPEQIEFLKSLAPIPTHWGGLGATELSLDPRDYDIRRLPGVSEMLAAGVPPSVDLTGSLRGEILNQGATGACVAYSTAHLCAVDDVIAYQTWPNINAALMYSRAGGMGSNGVDSRLVLEQAVESGVPLAAGGSFKIVKTYAFVPQEPGLFTETIKAALAAGYPVVLALLLPTDFGWQSGHGAVSQGYHQICLLGYSADGYWIFVNSWGSAWPGNSPHQGVGSVLQSYVEANGCQNRYAYCYTVTTLDANPPPPPPPPPPPVKTVAAVTGRATGADVSSLAPGAVYALGNGIALALKTVAFDDNPPPPGPLSVTGYTPNPVKGGSTFIIQGQGFQGGNLTASWQGRPLTANRLSDAQIQAVAPSVATTASDAVTVRVEGLTATGPSLTVTASDVTPGDLKVTVVARRYARGLVGIWAYVQTMGSETLDLLLPPTDDFVIPPTVLNPEAGGYAAATVTGSIGSLALATRRTTSSGIPAVWQLSGPPEAAVISITAVDDQDRRGTASLTI